MGKNALLLLVSLAAFGAAAGCYTPRVPQLGAGPFRRDDATLLDDALTAARDAGHPAVRVDAEHGRFAVAAQRGAIGTVFVVQCSRDGFIAVTPVGPSVGRAGDDYVVSRELRQEWSDLVLTLERSIPEAP